MTHDTNDTDHFCNTVESKSARSRNWFFTLNNYTADDIKCLTEVKGNEYQYVFQEEKGESGTPHLQGILMFKNARSFKSVKKLLKRAHLERVKNRLAAIRYCAKPETRIGNTYTNLDNLDTLLHSDTKKIEQKKMSQDEMRKHAIDNMEIPDMSDLDLKMGGGFFDLDMMKRNLRESLKENKYWLEYWKNNRKEI